MLEQPLLFTGCSSVQSFNSPPIPNMVGQDIFGTPPLTVWCLCGLKTPCYDIFHQVLPAQPVPREAESFPRGSKYPKDVSLPTFLAYLQPV